ncbi:hypothetical protein F5Y14DRAFT_286659 [Nemania sp. NC0429]|nr:hypothetical protein F5Y14DRAFT_286659 [Nemania sp. NC0429]
MDDPWGSPWASTDAPSNNDPPPPSRANVLLSPPPKAFFGSGSPGLSAQSPWSGSHDEDGFGIWATAERPEGADGQNEWSSWAESGVQPARLSPRLSSSGKESPLVWSGNGAASPGFRAHSRSRTPSTLRHHSPDPWAAEPSLTSRSDIELPRSSQVTSSNTTTVKSEQAEASQASPAITTSEPEWDKDDQERPVDAVSASDGVWLVRQNAGLAIADELANTSSSIDLAVYEIPSRPSSACTVDSHRELERQDSPITSIDEDRGTRTQHDSRKTSGKVQELVGKFDGLTRAASQEPPSSRRGTSRTASRQRSLERTDVEAGGDHNGGENEFALEAFEDALGNDDAGIIHSPGEASCPSELSITPKAELKDMLSRTSTDLGEEHDIVITNGTPLQSHHIATKFRDISFDPDPLLVDKLFPHLPDSIASGSTKSWEMSDQSINDSFTTISERKSWYRISRYGSMRKHNSGDDENYHGVTWSTSHLHSDTIKIVRRWMEQDSYAGRATLGGTKRTGFFDWDSDAAPVRLDEVFRRKKLATKHARMSSIPSNDITIRTTPTDGRPYRNSTGILLAPELKLAGLSNMPIPSFDWNSESGTVAPVTGFSHRHQNSNDTPASIAAQVPIHHPAPIQTTSADEDDDWGEMVSSPRATEPVTSASSIPEAPNESPRPIAQHPPSIFTTNQSTEPRESISERAQSATLDLQSLSGTSASNRPNQISKLSKGHVLEASTPPSGLSSLSQGSTVRSQFSSQNIITSQATISKTSPAGEPLPGKIMAPATPINRSSCESQDDIIVQRILQGLPDLSYMLR